MEKVDGLSRRPDWKVGVDKDNENQIVVKDSWLHRLEEVIVEGPEVEMIKKARGKNEEIVRIVEEMKKVGVKAIQEEE